MRDAQTVGLTQTYCDGGNPIGKPDIRAAFAVIKVVKLDILGLWKHMSEIYEIHEAVCDLHVS